MCLQGVLGIRWWHKVPHKVPQIIQRQLPATVDWSRYHTTIQSVSPSGVFSAGDAQQDVKRSVFRYKLSLL